VVVSFDFLEAVRVEPRPDCFAAIQRRIGAVLGKSVEEGQEPTSYAVDLDGVDELVEGCAGPDLTGKLRHRDGYRDGTSLRVSERREVLD
jgi:hypothetical protein